MSARETKAEFDAYVKPFRCDECEKTWDRSDLSLIVLRGMVADHLWSEHGIRHGTDASEDRLPMTPDQIAWCRAQRQSRRTP